MHASAATPAAITQELVDRTAQALKILAVNSCCHTRIGESTTGVEVGRIPVHRVAERGHLGESAPKDVSRFHVRSKVEVEPRCVHALPSQ